MIHERCRRLPRPCRLEAELGSDNRPEVVILLDKLVVGSNHQVHQLSRGMDVAFSP